MSQPPPPPPPGPPPGPPDGPPPPPPQSPADRDAARRAALRELGRWWSTARFLRTTLVVLVLVHLVNGVVMAFNPGWRTHLLFQTDRTVVEVVAVDRDAVSCGRYNSGDRLHLAWTDADGVDRESTAQCIGHGEVGERFTAYPVPGDGAYDWPTYEFYVFSAVISLLLGAGLTVVLGWPGWRDRRPRGEPGDRAGG